MASVEALSCPICTNLVENNRECNGCGTLYCYECIKEWSTRNPSCPQCRKSIIIKDLNDSSSFTFNRFVERTVNDFEVDCPNGCSQKKVKRGNLTDHLERLCENMEKPCEMAKYGCLFRGKLVDLQKHMAEECAYCKVKHILERYELQVVDLTSKLSTLEQRNAMLNLDNEELKDKVRKLSSTKQSTTTPTTSQSSSSPPPTTNQQQFNSNGSTHQQQQFNNSSSRNSAGNNGGGRYQSPPSSSSSYHQPQQQYPSTNNNSNNQNYYQNNNNNQNYQNFNNNNYNSTTNHHRNNSNGGGGGGQYNPNYQSSQDRSSNNSHHQHHHHNHNNHQHHNSSDGGRRNSKKNDCKQQ